MEKTEDNGRQTGAIPSKRTREKEKLTRRDRKRERRTERPRKTEENARRE